MLGSELARYLKARLPQRKPKPTQAQQQKNTTETTSKKPQECRECHAHLSQKTQNDQSTLDPLFPAENHTAHMNASIERPLTHAPIDTVGSESKQNKRADE